MYWRRRGKEVTYSIPRIDSWCAYGDDRDSRSLVYSAVHCLGIQWNPLDVASIALALVAGTANLLVLFGQ